MKTIIFTLILAMFSSLGPAARAEHFRLALNDAGDQYIADILTLALEPEGGHTVETIPRILLMQTKALEQLNSPDRRYDVHYSGYLPARAGIYSMVRFPITRGMLGHRLLAIAEKDLNLFAPVHNLADLRRLAVMGAGKDWPDANIMRAAGLNVITASDSLLWPMLAKGRFNAFPRGINEIDQQIEQHQTRDRERLGVEPHLLLRYRLDLFFFLPKDEPEKAAVIETGLQAAFETGALDRLLENHPAFQAVLYELRAHDRTVIELQNPVMDENRSGIPARYWRAWP